MTVLRLNTQIMKLWGSNSYPSDSPSPRAEGPGSGYVGLKVYCKLSYLEEEEEEEKEEEERKSVGNRLKRAYIVITNKDEEERIFYHKSCIPFSLEELIQLRS